MSIADSEQFNLLDQLAQEFAERFRRGERPALKEYADRHPELADEIRELFPALVKVEQVDEGQINHESEVKTPGPSRSPRQIGDYRILGEIGRGGMGVVYEAEQISLCRRVALKVLPGHMSSDPMVQERFRREVRAAARPRHTNILPVFEVGQDRDVRFCAMQLIQGQGLDLVVMELRQVRDRAWPESKIRFIVVIALVCVLMGCQSVTGSINAAASEKAVAEKGLRPGAVATKVPGKNIKMSHPPTKTGFSPIPTK